MKKAVRLLLILFLALSLNGCDTWDDWFGDDDDDDETVDVIETTAAQDTSSDTASVKTTSTDATATATTSDSSSGSETAVYFGTTNGGLPTWYFSNHMSTYPTSFTLTLKGCGSATVDNNGHRWTGLGCILKQSEVYGRGMGLICTGCSPSNAKASW